jgi:uncharacterized protein DUF222
MVSSHWGCAMSVAEIRQHSDDPASYSTTELAGLIVSMAERLASMECQWLTYIADFDRREGWYLDGQLSCVDWLVWKCGLSRRTAYERVRVAHELRRRPAIRDAFARGELSYSKVRAITRIEGADEETDRWLLKLAKAGTVRDLERVVRRYEQLKEQERGVDDYLRRYERRGTYVSRTYDGMMVIEKVLPIEEGEEYLAHLDASVDECSREQSSTAQRRTDAALALARAGRASLDKPSSGDRFTVHVVTEIEALIQGSGRAELLDGTSIGIKTLQRMTCDSDIVRHIVKGGSEPLDIGRLTAVWTTAQRRAITVRDKGTCRWPGCHRRTCDCHHVIWFDKGGRTAVDNGCLLCPRHHTCVHEGGFTIIGTPNGELVFYRPDGVEVGRG